MSIAIISDTHLGDASSWLVNKQNQFTPDGVYKQLKEGIFNFTGNKSLEYLVLNGDILDFSINSFANSIKIGRPFFQQISSDKLADKIIYIPGNHDKQVWDGVQWDTSVIGNLSNYENPVPFVRVQAGIIDISNSPKFVLEGIEPDEEGKYGDIFLKGLFEKDKKNPEMILVYPNLYIKNNSETILVTHGHMFETAWILLSETLRGTDNIPNEVGLKELEEWNIPLTSMICTGIGGGGKVSELFYKIQQDAYHSESGTMKKVLKTILPRLETTFGMSSLGKFMIPNWLINLWICSKAKKAEDPKEYDLYFEQGGKDEHFNVFYNATKMELERLKLTDPQKIIFGHTHHPYPAAGPYISKKLPGYTFYNTGGWLKGGLMWKKKKKIIKQTQKSF
jgi:predicted phosphodiesterase